MMSILHVIPKILEVWLPYRSLSDSLGMMTSSNGNIFRVTGHLCGKFSGHRWIPRTKNSDAELWYFLWSACINDWVNNSETGDLRRHCANYDVTVMGMWLLHGTKTTRTLSCESWRSIIINSLRPSDAYMRQGTGSALVQVIACRLYDTKPLSEPMLAYCQLGTNFSEIWMGILSGIFNQENAFEIVVCQNGGHWSWWWLGTSH